MDPRTISYPSVPGRMTRHQTNGTKLQECLYFKKSQLLKEVEMPPLLLPLKPVKQEGVDLAEDQVNPEEEMIEDQEDLGAEIVKAEAVDHYLAFVNWQHIPPVY